MAAPPKRAHVCLLAGVLLVLPARLGAQEREGSDPPLLYLEEGEVSLTWRDTGERGHATLAARLVRPKLRVERAPSAAEEEAPPAEAPIPGAGEALEEVSPIPLDLPRIEILEGELLFLDPSSDPPMRIWLHDLEIAIENVASADTQAHDAPALLTAKGLFGRSGELTVFATFNPWSPGLELAGRAQLVGLDARELYDVLAATTGMYATAGEVDLFVEFVVRDGELTGGVKPVLKGVEVRPAEDESVVTAAQAWLVDQTLDLVSDRVPGRQAVATVVPIRGTIRDPSIGIWRTLGGVLRNAFLEALRLGFTNVPPPTAQLSAPPQAEDAAP